MIRHPVRCTLAHLLHALVLLWPSWVWAPHFLWRDPYVLTFALGVVALAILESNAVAGEAGAGCPPVHDRVALRIAAFVGVGLLVTFWLAQIEHWASHANSPHPAIHIIGAQTLLLGVVLRVWAIRSLGARFISDIRVDGPVSRQGIYAYLRHPSEAGLILVAAGAPLLLGSWRTATIATALILPVSLWRMRREDAALCESG